MLYSSHCNYGVLKETTTKHGITTVHRANLNTFSGQTSMHRPQAKQSGLDVFSSKIDCTAGHELFLIHRLQSLQLPLSTLTLMSEKYSRTHVYRPIGHIM